LALALGIVVASVSSVVVGLPTLRVRGPVAAVTTLAFAVAASSYLLVHRFVPWLIDDNMQRPVLWHRISLSGEAATYELCLAGVLASVIAVRNLRRSRTGRAMLAVRDNEAAAAAAGISTMRVKLTAFAVSGAIAGLAGGLYVILQQGLQADSYTPEASLRLFAMVILGGLSSISGVVAGAVVIRGTEVLFPSGWALLASGFGVTALVALFPEGLGGLIVRARDLVVRS
jgi:branched-chain amino acid transport system permease protein